MRWQGGRRSDNIDDRRGVRMPGGVAGGGVGVVVIALIALFFGVDPRAILQDAGSPAPQSGGPVDPAQEGIKDFVSVVLADTEDTWGAIFQEGGARYQMPRLVLFTGAVQSACGFARSAVGPFYCSGDRQVYLDLEFFDALEHRLGASGDFAQAYVIAHEVGHHVQNLLGITAGVAEAAQRGGQSRANQLSVRQELQADCFAGIWANHANRSRQVLEAGDVEEGLSAAAAIGDDRLQMQARGHVVPESFTHGSSRQRVRWFRQGLEAGSLAACDTFKAARL